MGRGLECSCYDEAAGDEHAKDYLYVGLIFVLTGAIAMFGSIAISASESTTSALTREFLGASIEGFAGGLMFAMVAAAMLPEALHGAGELSGLFYVVGFVSISMISDVGLRIG